MRKNVWKKCLWGLALCGVLMTSVVSTQAATFQAQKTGIKQDITSAAGIYSNWDGVSDGAQFLDNQGNVCLAYNKKNSVVIVKTKNGKPLKKTITLKKAAPTFGAATCDQDGNFYVVTGKTNNTDDTTTETVFVTKYDAGGKLLATVGDNGSSSLAYYYGERFYTKIPFDGGNCDSAVNGDYVAVNYAREMYSGHQSNSLLLVNRKTMQKEKVEKYYNSHSFAQRVIPWGNGFLLASEGDCYDRAFTVSELKNNGGWSCDSQNIFSFWIAQGAYDRYNMHEVNENFARMGGLAVGNEQNAAFVARSVKSLNSNAKKENEQLFIQIFNPTADLNSASGYVTSGTRSGMSGKNGDEQVTDYGVKWLTNYSKMYTIENPQVVATDAGNYVVLFERYKKYNYQGVYAIVVNAAGTVTQKATRISATAYLNPCRMPVYSNGKVWWTENKTKGKDIYLYSYAVK